MPRALLMPVALLACAAALAAPIPKPLKAKKATELAGTKWMSEEQADLGRILYTFHEGGKLTYAYKAGAETVYTDASWTQDGEQVYYECNKKYVEYKGKLSGEVIELSALNVAGRSWTVKLHRQDAEK